MEGGEALRRACHQANQHVVLHVASVVGHLNAVVTPSAKTFTPKEEKWSRRKEEEKWRCARLRSRGGSSS